MVADSPNHAFYVSRPKSQLGPVETWSIQRLPFEPKGWLRELRSELGSALSLLATTGPDEVLHGVYASASSDMCDTENILFYNVGSACFAPSCRAGLRFERVFGPPRPSPVPLSGAAQHYHRYGVVARDGGFVAWQAGRMRAVLGAIPCPSLRGEIKLERFWYAIMRARGRIVVAPGPPPDLFGLRIVVQAPAGITVNSAAKVKGVFDATVAALHAHDGSALSDLSTRVARKLQISAAEVAAYLSDDSSAVLGSRRLLWAFQEGVQWNPADHRCVAGELLVRADSNDGSWNLSAELFEVTPAHHAARAYAGA